VNEMKTPWILDKKMVELKLDIKDEVSGYIGKLIFALRNVLFRTRG